MTKKSFNRKSLSYSELSLKNENLAERLAIKHPAACLSLVKDIFIGGQIRKADRIDSYERDFARELLIPMVKAHPALVIPVLIDILAYTRSSYDIDVVGGMLQCQLARTHPEETAKVVKNALLTDVVLRFEVRKELYRILEETGHSFSAEEKKEHNYIYKKSAKKAQDMTNEYENL